MRQYEEEHRVTYYECDATGRLSLSMLVALFILASRRHNTALGFSPQKVRQTNGGWVIIDYDGQFPRPLPKEGAALIIGTAITAYNRFFIIRDFWARDRDGAEYAHFRGMFAYMDLTTRKMQEIPAEFIAQYPEAPSRHLPRLQRPRHSKDTHGWTRKDYQVRFFDIDFNGHVNNARYFDWLLDPLGTHFLLHHRITKLAIRYRNEIQPDKLVASLVRLEETAPAGQAVSSHQIKVGNDLCTEATITWQLE